MKKIVTLFYILFWTIAAFQSNDTLLSTILIASVVGYIFLNIAYEAIDNRRIL